MSLRDAKAESIWTAHPIIGYVPLDKHGKPHQAELSNRYFAVKGTRKKPITIYKTMAKAASYSPVSTAVEVRMFETIEVQS
jgi:hypothetical protein